jgi:hypothetical protein
MIEYQTSMRSRVTLPVGTPIRTTILELVETLSSLTRDDNLVVSAVKEIFSSHKIIATRSLAPVKLVVKTPHAMSGAGRHRACSAQRQYPFEAAAYRS